MESVRRILSATGKNKKSTHKEFGVVGAGLVGLFLTAFLIFKTYLPNPTHGVNQRHLEDYYRVFCRHPY